MGQAINHSLNTLFLSLVTHLCTKGVTSWPWTEVREEEESRGFGCLFPGKGCMDVIHQCFTWDTGFSDFPYFKHSL